MHRWFVRAAASSAWLAMLSLSAASAQAQSYQYTPYSAPSTTPNFNAVPGYSVVPPATVNPPTPIVGPPHTHFSPSVPYGGGWVTLLL